MINGRLVCLEAQEAGLHVIEVSSNRMNVYNVYRGSGGKPFGDGDKEKWYIFGATGAIALLATLAFWEMGYKEIGWKEFVHKYVLLLLHIFQINFL